MGEGMPTAGESELTAHILLAQARTTLFSVEPSRRGKAGALWACGPSCAPLHPPGPPRWRERAELLTAIRPGLGKAEAVSHAHKAPSPFFR